MRRVAAFAALALLLAGVLGVAAPASAQGSGERILAFVVDVTINADTSLSVTEQIRYDFGDNERHGIFREIPV
ncbi:MAG: DUF2207 domain-containing protein, partial [Actinomycetota bacterium]|nr:DUF2207 domain-containing protein [Actinomycetota bacterium]